MIAKKKQPTPAVTPAKQAPQAELVCQVEDCDWPAHTRGLCAEHWISGSPLDVDEN